MTWALLAGAVAGAGLYLLVRVFVRPAASVGVRLARLDAVRAGSSRTASPQDSQLSSDRLRQGLGDKLEAWVDERGLTLTRLRSDLDVLGRPLGSLLATKVLVAVGTLIWMPVLWLSLGLFGVPVPSAAPAVITLVVAAVFFVLPDLQVHSEAQARRKDFRHVLGSFLDLVAMNLAGGRGLPEALVASASIGDHWAMVRIRQALAGARMEGLTPWEALGRLGTEIGIDEMRDLAGALTLAGDEGARIRSSLSARAESMRRRELADAEGKAGENSQSMLVAQLLICSSFLIFLAYPATYSILQS